MIRLVRIIEWVIQHKPTVLIDKNKEQRLDELRLGHKGLEIVNEPRDWTSRNWAELIVAANNCVTKI